MRKSGQTLRKKFQQNEDLKQSLMATSSKKLVEAVQYETNSCDRYSLGKILMEVRDELANEENEVQNK